MKESQRADHAVIEIRMTHISNEDSPGIYTLGDRRREEAKTSHKRLIPRTLLHKDQLPKKKRSDPKDSENPPQSTISL